MEEDESNDGFGPKSPSAIDFYDYGELSDEIEEFTDESSSKARTADENSTFQRPISPPQQPTTANDAKSDEPVNALVGSQTLMFPDKPLASVLPPKYQDIDVKKLFPKFYEHKVIRFLQTFGGKPSSRPNIWRGVRKKKTERKVEAAVSLPKPLRECEVESDEEQRFMQHKERSLSGSTEESTSDLKALKNWRFGAAKLWYDMAEIPETAETYDYGFKLKDSHDETHVDEYIDDMPDEAFLMVSQVPWEDDVIWDGAKVKDEVMQHVYNTNKAAGWIPVSSDRTVSSFLEHCKYTSSHLNGTSRFPLPVNRFDQSNMAKRKETALSMFPEENLKLLYDPWEQDVIWDYEAMQRILPPMPVEINDSNIILEIPEDQPPSSDNLEPTKDPKEKKIRPVVKKPDEGAEESSLIDIKPDFFNISNDEYYNPKMTQETALKLNYGGTVLQHSIPALELRKPYFPTYIMPIKLRCFHRPPLRRYANGPMSKSDPVGVVSLTRFIKKVESERQREREESGGGDMFFMRTPDDLSGKDGDLVLFEFSEEYPPLMMQVGMASKIRNYYRRRKQLPGKEDELPTYKYGETAFCHTSPFLGTLQPGRSLQAYENNLYRAPIYEQASSDFLVIRTRYQYFIREIDTIYTVGQQLPLIEVPAPKSEKANNFIRDFLSVYIYRLFRESADTPRKLRVDTIKKAFPAVNDSGMRKRLNMCADFQRTGPEARSWLWKSTVRLPEEDEIREMVSPEQCCAYYSMLAAEQRLKDAGYRDKFSFVAEGENDDLQTKIEDEVKAAPWNTTQAFLSAIKGKCLLELSGGADPTGCGEGFSYIKAPHKPQWSKEDNGVQNPAKRIVKGTDADLRRLPLKRAKQLLRSFNIPEQDIKSLSRWQIIDVVRTFSTRQAKAGEDGNTKFARGNFHGQAEHFRKYREECQRLFELQNTVLGSSELLSTDEDSSSENSDIEEMGKHLEDMLSNKKTIKDLSHEAEEAQRKELQKMMSSDASNDENQKKVEKNDSPNMEGKIVKIYRTYQDSNGKYFVRTETVRRTAVIQMYLKISETKDPEFIKRYSLDEESREEIRRERRRIQDQLRRIRRNELKGMNKEPPKKKRKIENPREMLKVKCGACGETGHMRTNKSCRLFQNSPCLPPIPVAMTEEQEEAEEMSGLNDINLIKIDETKVILSKQLIKHADEIRRKSLVIKIPKEAVTGSSKKRKSNNEEPTSDYLSTPKAVNRKRVDPLVSLSVMFEKLITELKALPNTQPFWFPVQAKQAPNYHDFIDKPMDLLSMKDKVRRQTYKNREDLMLDLKQIVDNSKTYNGAHSFLTVTANEMLEHCFRRFEEDEEKLMELEKAINPLLDTDQVAFSYVLEKIVSDHLKTVPESWPFHKPVDKRVTKGYYSIVKHPMDLDTLIKNCKAHKYKNRSAFLSDVELIYSNCSIFNGAGSQFTKIAQEIVKACHISFDAFDKQLESLERGIDSVDNLDQVNNCSPPPNPIKHRVTFKLANRSGLNLNGSLDTDSIVDVESIETPSKSLSERDLISSDKSDFDPMDYKLEESNSCLFSPDMDPDLEQRSGSASPLISSKTQSLLSLNGILKHEGIADSFQNISQPYSQFSCDNICDDLMLSESDSDEEQTLKF